jgi:hypothetical protein
MNRAERLIKLLRDKKKPGAHKPPRKNSPNKNYA